MPDGLAGKEHSMSAYVVEDKTINKIVDWLLLDWMGSRQAAKHALNGYNLDIDGDAERLANDMFRLNVSAVNQRYGPGEAAKFRPLDFQYSSVVWWGDSAIANACRALKSLHCWQYQCSEGNVPETPLFKMFEEVESAIARWLVGTMPEYEQADWN